MHRDRSSRRRRSASRRKTVQPEPPCAAPTPAPEPSQASAARREQTTKRRGELAELVFALKAASLGFGVSRPWGDSERYDFILDADNLHPPSASSLSPSLIPTAARQRTNRTGARTGCPAEPKAPKGRKNPEDAGAPLCGRSLQDENASVACVRTYPLSRLWRVQVKGSSSLVQGLYFVNCGRHCNGRVVPYTPAEIDFFAGYVIPEDTWYILPVQLVASRSSVLFRRKRDRKPGLYDAYREAWHLLRQS